MPFNDLNIAYNGDHTTLSNTLLFAKELGYETVALSLAVVGKLPNPPPSVPIPAITKPDGLNLLTRLTLTIADTTQNHRLTSLNAQYDILALRPTNEKTLQLCCSSLECDIISLDFSQRLPFVLKFKTVASALQRGIRFEICYSPGIVAGNDARRNLISGASQLIRATRGRGIILSSEAKGALGLRAPWDTINLAQVWGLPQQRAKEAVCEEAGKVVRLAGIKRTSFRGVVDIIDGGAQPAVVKKEKGAEAGQVVGSHLQGTASSSAKQKPPTVTNGVKRKASTLSSNALPLTEQANHDSVSKRELKRRAKQARLEGKKMSNVDTDDRSVPLPLQHESLMSKIPR